MDPILSTGELTQDLLRIAPDVQAALSTGRPVVALESTIISHGLPYPDNLVMARSVEEVVRRGDALPATIAVIDGAIRVGLDAPALERLASGKDVAKAASRDLALMMVRRQTAGTTVSATMRIAALAGIQVFATGGIGGVHRGAESSMDISADLIELAHTPVAVVCAGAKSILDIPRTLEFLETQRVPVVAFGSDEMPAFYSRHSGHKVDRLDLPAEVARLWQLHRHLGSGSGMLVANPIPELDGLIGEAIERTIAEALEAAQAQAVAGKDLTPFLLARINERSHGASLSANIALVRNNAALAAAIAANLARLGKAA